MSRATYFLHSVRCSPLRFSSMKCCLRHSIGSVCFFLEHIPSSDNGESEVPPQDFINSGSSSKSWASSDIIFSIWVAHFLLKNFDGSWSPSGDCWRITKCSFRHPIILPSISFSFDACSRSPSDVFSLNTFMQRLKNNLKWVLFQILGLTLEYRFGNFSQDVDSVEYLCLGQFDEREQPFYMGWRRRHRPCFSSHDLPNNQQPTTMKIRVG